MADDLVQEALRRLVLSVRREREHLAVDAVVSTLTVGGIERQDQAGYLRLESARWREAGKPAKLFATAVRAYLKAGDDQFGPELAKAYFKVHERLAKLARFDHDSAVALLSHAHLIASLAREDGLSAAQIAKLLSQRAPSLPTSWSATDKVLAALKLRPRLEAAEVERLFGQDTVSEERAFADADPETCIQIIAEVGAELGLAPEFGDALRRFFDDPFPPYLMILHYLCSIAEYYDHPPEFPYEFSPRGKAYLWLSEQYPDSLSASPEAFLNNAKSVDSLDRNWANSKKKKHSQQAHALVTVVEALGGLGFAARRDLASWIRRLIVRTIRLAQGTGVTLAPFGPDQIRRLVAAVEAGPTNTLGVLEQRLVDAAALLRHPASDWVSRGLGDSVNATNVSRRKCGDCDFQNAAGLEVRAYEAHAGKLSEIYMEAHARTLGQVLEKRGREWRENFGDGQWQVSVTFVAHGTPLSSPPLGLTMDGVDAAIDSILYEELFDGLDPDAADTVAAFSELVHTPLMEPRTPESVRQRVAALVA